MLVAAISLAILLAARKESAMIGSKRKKKNVYGRVWRGEQ